MAVGVTYPYPMSNTQGLVCKRCGSLVIARDGVWARHRRYVHTDYAIFHQACVAWLAGDGRILGWERLAQ